jgi:hypothetical protein
MSKTRDKANTPQTNFSSTGIDDNATSTAVTIDSSQNVGIGTSSPSELLEVNGNIRVGVGSQTAPSLQIGDNDTGIFDAGANAIGFTTAGTEKVRILSGGSVAIGATSAAQKLHVEGSIYTSGSLYVGGTGSANALDDYEEGTFTATLKGGSAEPGTLVTTTGYYTKVGKLVHFQIGYEAISSSGYSGALFVNGLPFTNTSSARSMVTVGLYKIGSFGTGYVIGEVNDGGTTVSAFEIRSANTWEPVQHTSTTGAYLWIAGTYRTN